jgi:hypothetical protein
MCRISWSTSRCNEEPSSAPEGVEFMQDLECPLIVRDGEESSATWLEYVYRTAHPALRWLPTKLAEWIGENMQDELGFADKANKRAATGIGGPVDRSDCEEAGCCQRCAAQACSRDKTGSQDGSSLIQSKGSYISVYTKLYMVYLSIYCFLLSLHNLLSAHMFFPLLAAGCTILSKEDV